MGNGTQKNKSVRKCGGESDDIRGECTRTYNTGIQRITARISGEPTGRHTYKK